MKFKCGYRTVNKQILNSPYFLISTVQTRPLHCLLELCCHNCQANSQSPRSLQAPAGSLPQQLRGHTGRLDQWTNIVNEGQLLMRMCIHLCLWIFMKYNLIIPLELLNCEVLFPIKPGDSWRGLMKEDDF